MLGRAARCQGAIKVLFKRNEGGIKTISAVLKQYYPLA
jgi:hypothetical protein